MRPNLWAIVILVIVVLVLFGAKRLPDVASSIGKSLKIFKKEVKELTEDDPAPRPTPVTSSASTTAPAPVEPLPGAPARAATPIEHRTT